MSQAAVLFEICVSAIRRGELIHRDGEKDKEFHFQNWFARRLREHTPDFEMGGRNSYPDFRLSYEPEGYELKGLAYPGRDASYDCNSQVPCGYYRGKDGKQTPREVYTVFGRYPAKPDGNRYPVIDLVICHGAFLNAETDYVHKNKHFKGFGSYGDIMVRDRKMYVAPTPFALVEGSAHQRTLILPATDQPSDRLIKVGDLIRREVDQIVVAYAFDLRTSQITSEKLPNPNSGKEHHFVAYRVAGDPSTPVSLRDTREVLAALEEVEKQDEDNDD